MLFWMILKTHLLEFMKGYDYGIAFVYKLYYMALK